MYSGIHTQETAGKGLRKSRSGGFIEDYVVPEDDVARYGDTQFGTIVGQSISQYVRGDRSIDRVWNQKRH